jgi:hypothetical protein
MGLETRVLGMMRIRTPSISVSFRISRSFSSVFIRVHPWFEKLRAKAGFYHTATMEGTGGDGLSFFKLTLSVI